MNENLKKSVKIDYLINEWKLHIHNLNNVIRKLKKVSLENIDERIKKEAEEILKSYENKSFYFREE